MIIVIPDQEVCMHRAQLAFKKTQGMIGAVYEISCDKDSECPNQPERSKREDSQECEMRCSEHCGNTVREVQ